MAVILAKKSAGRYDRLKISAMPPKTAYRPQSVLSRAENNSKILNQIKTGSTGFPGRKKTRQPSEPVAGRKKRVSVLVSLPLLSVLGICLLGTIFLFDNRESISAAMYRDAIPAPHSDSGAGTNMAAFADRSGTGARIGLVNESGITSVDSTQAAVTPAVVPGVAINEIALRETPDSSVQPIPLKMVEYFAWESYTVVRGDTVSSIAASRGLSMDAVIVSNNMSNANQLRIGQNLRLPNMDGIPYTVKAGDTLSHISKEYNIPLDVIVDVNNIQRDYIYPDQVVFLPGARMPARDLKLAIGTFFVSPLSGTAARLTSPYGWRKDPFNGSQRLHEAVDLAIATGTPVKAASAGKVVLVGNSPVYGRYIILDHGNGFQTLYAHLSASSVKQGDQVQQGTKIGEVGSTGLSTGPHLHFAVYKDNRAVNPLEYFVH